MSASALEKIRRLLRLGQSQNKHEAESAMAMAAKIALKHQIDLASVKDDQEREQIAHEWFGSRAAYNDVEQYATQVVISVFPVNGVYNGRTQIAFVGTPTAIASAKWALDFLIERARKELAQWRKEKRLSGSRPTRSSERNWLRGWGIGVIKAFNAEKKANPELCDSSTAIILADQEKERESYVEENITKKKARKCRAKNHDPDAFLAGARVGMQTKLQQPISGASPDLLALTNGY